MEKMVVGIDISKATIDACIVNASDVHERNHDSFLNKALWV
jgi:transposase